MPRSSLICFRLTSRAGRAVLPERSFMRLIKSVPPAITSVLPHSLSSRFVAALIVLGLACSKACIRPVLLLVGTAHASNLLKRCEHLVRRERQRRHTNTDRVGYRIGNGRARRDHRRFTQADHAA